MMKLASLLKSRASISGNGILNKNNAIGDVVGLQTSMSRAGISTAGHDFQSNDRIFASYSIYKGKAALSAEPLPPTFSKLNSGGLFVKRKGAIMLSFSPSMGERKYDWTKKQKFALSATEIGSLINLGPNGSCELYHDPAKMSSNEGQVRKSLSVKANADGTGYFISLCVVNNLTKTNERFTVPVTSAEFAVMRTSFSFALPYIMGWDRYSSQQPTFAEGKSLKSSPQRLASEWDR